MSKRPLDAENEARADEPSPKRARTEDAAATTPASLGPEAVAKVKEWLAASYKKDVLEYIPEWIQAQNLCMHGPIGWDQKKIALEPGLFGYERILWSAAAQYAERPPTEEQLRAFWLLYFGGQHAKNHYGSYELQVLLFCVINEDDLGANKHLRVAKAWRDLCGAYLQTRDSRNAKELYEAVNSILTHRTQVIHVDDVTFLSTLGRSMLSLRYHSLVDSWRDKEMGGAAEEEEEASVEL